MVDGRIVACEISIDTADRSSNKIIQRLYGSYKLTGTRKYEVGVTRNDVNLHINLHCESFDMPTNEILTFVSRYSF